MSDHLIFTVHGVETFGRWQDRLEGLLRSTGKHFTVKKYKYDLSLAVFIGLTTLVPAVAGFALYYAFVNSHQWLAFAALAVPIVGGSLALFGFVRWMLGFGFRGPDPISWTS